jgi:CxxH/CxxC protein (TIGR04129 family)
LSTERRKRKGEENMKVNCCLEHVELALDIVVDETEEAPIMKELDKELCITCEYCENNATYIVGNE